MNDSDQPGRDGFTPTRLDRKHDKAGPHEGAWGEGMKRAFCTCMFDPQSHTILNVAAPHEPSRLAPRLVGSDVGGRFQVGAERAGADSRNQT
jgi:hypothetical protein